MRFVLPRDLALILPEKWVETSGWGPKLYPFTGRAWAIRNILMKECEVPSEVLDGQNLYVNQRGWSSPCPETRAITCARVHTRAKSPVRAKNRPCQHHY